MAVRLPLSAGVGVSFDLERDSVVRGEDDLAYEIGLNFIPEEISAPKLTPKPVKSRPQAVPQGLLRPRDLDCYKELDNPGRPKLLGHVLDGMQESLAESDTMFKHFVELSERATQEARACEALDIRCSLKYSKSEIELTEESDASANGSNTMIMAFMFYAAMQQGGSVSFQATELANETMSYFELDKFCRDFDIVPKLLTKSEVKAIWQDFIAIHAQTTGGVPLQALKYTEFQDMFVRLALFAYSKPGMRKMILAVTGFFPQPKDHVEALAHYCKFDDFHALQAQIRSVGRETQGALNYRSANDSNSRARAEIRIDLRAKYLARLTAKENKDKEAAEAEKEKKRRQAAGEEEETAEVKKKTVQYGLWSSLNGKNYEKTGGLFKINRKTSNYTSLLPAEIQDLLSGRTDSAPATPVGGSLAEASGEASAEASLRLDKPVEEELMTYDKATAIAKRVGTRIGVLETQYDRDLVSVLNKYSRTDAAPEKAGIVVSDGAFLDAGHLSPNTDCSGIISLTNLALDIVLLEVSSDGFSDPNTRVIFAPKPIISGMTRQIVVKFNSGVLLGSFVGVVTVVGVANTGLRSTVRIPVYYRMDSTTTQRALLTKKTLPEMCTRYLGRPFHPDGTFEKKKKAEDGMLWLRPQSAATARRSYQDMRPDSALALNALRVGVGTVAASLTKTAAAKTKPSSAVSTAGRTRLEPLSAAGDAAAVAGPAVASESDPMPARAATAVELADRRTLLAGAGAGGNRIRPSTAKA